jgi:hypothetical protein
VFDQDGGDQGQLLGISTATRYGDIPVAMWLTADGIRSADMGTGVELFETLTIYAMNCEAPFSVMLGNPQGLTIPPNFAPQQRVAAGQLPGAPLFIKNNVIGPYNYNTTLTYDAQGDGGAGVICSNVTLTSCPTNQCVGLDADTVSVVGQPHGAMTIQ